ncbi:hypothetical protein EDC01DRAFT_75644 [Geopyxis carbonaria]|nr:hypothetical protein EDC01DRAFT_75644 [Geopyxis carbonaria]
MDTLLATHRKELRDLQARLTQKKKSATKKTRKSVNAECDTLEAETRARHAREVAALNDPDAVLDNGDGGDDGVYVPPPDSDVEEEAAADSISAPSTPATSIPSTTSTPPQQQQPKKPNRQKARLARRAAEISAASAAAASEASSQPNLRATELAHMSKLLETHGLREHAIAPDGHCLYSAFAHSLALPGGYAEARKRCAAQIRGRREEYEGFLEEGVEAYADKVERTAEWGGEVEVRALAREFGVEVVVLQAEGRGVVRMGGEEEGEGEKEGEGKGEEKGNKEVWLGYYRHAFGLGEHYNALEKKPKEEKAAEKS